MLATCIRLKLVISGFFTVGNYLLLKHTFPKATKKTLLQVQRLDWDGNPSNPGNYRLITPYKMYMYVCPPGFVRGGVRGRVGWRFSWN